MIKEIFEPSVANRFSVSFFNGRMLNQLDASFQSISGLGRELHLRHVQQGGDNTSSYWLPGTVAQNRIVLKRGLMTVTPLTLMFDQMLSAYTLHYSTVVIVLCNQLNRPVCSWTLRQAIPVKWHTDPLDAQDSKVLINTLELAYESMHWRGDKG